MAVARVQEEEEKEAEDEESVGIIIESEVHGVVGRRSQEEAKGEDDGQSEQQIEES